MQKVRYCTLTDDERFLPVLKSFLIPLGWLGSRVVSVLDSGAKGLGSNRSRDAVE